MPTRKQELKEHLVSSPTPILERVLTAGARRKALLPGQAK